MQRILIIFVHPALEKSRVQTRLLQIANAMEHVTVHDLYEQYPDFSIDISHEQQLLREHDIILFQHPFYWYSAPALLKEWQDLVLEYGFAYGPDSKLRGKIVLSVISAGGRFESYRRQGHNYYTIRELLTPFEQTARLCGMHYLPPFVIHGTLQLNDVAINRYSADYSSLLQRLQYKLPDTRTDSSGELAGADYLNDWIKGAG